MLLKVLILVAKRWFRLFDCMRGSILDWLLELLGVFCEFIALFNDQIIEILIILPN